MLNIYFAATNIALEQYPDLIWNIDSYFDYNYIDEWLDDPLVKQIVKDIDDTDIVSQNLAISPVLGPIPITKLSGGAKALIVMLKESSKIIDTTVCGENCTEWITKIANIHDLTITVGYLMPFHKYLKSTQIFCLNNSRQITTVDEYFEFAVLGIHRGE